MGKEEIIARLESRAEWLDGLIERINDGDLSFSEAGDIVHNIGDSVTSAIYAAIQYIEESDNE